MKLHSLVPVALPVILLPFLFGGQPAQLSAPAQQSAPASGPALRKPAPDVVFTVTVHDKHGNPVTGLTPADFTLTEDGRPQTIKSLSLQSDLPLLLGLEFDTSRTIEGALNAERSAGQKFVEAVLPAAASQPKPSTQAFLVHFDNEVELLEDFTAAPAKLNRELSQMTMTAKGRSIPQVNDSGNDNPRSGGNNGPYGNGGGNNGPYGRNGGSNGGNGRERGESNARGGTQLYDAIYLAANELMMPKVGRKALIVFSDGVDRNSKETQSEAIDSAERAGTSVYTIYYRGGDQQQSPLSNIGRGGGMGGGNRGGMGGGYPGGNRGGGTQQRAPIDGKKVMQDIAARTGGQFFEVKKTDALEGIYTQIASQLQSQYTLVYTPDQPDTEGGYHKVALKPKKDDLTVVMRQGYYAPGAETR
jgi:VWFA-related protein